MGVPQAKSANVTPNQTSVGSVKFIDQLVEMFSNPSNPLHIRNGGLIGLAGTAIALGVDVAPYMEKFVWSLCSSVLLILRTGFGISQRNAFITLQKYLRVKFSFTSIQYLTR